MCVTRIKLALMINAGMLLASSREAHLRWTLDRSRVNWEEFVHYQVRANPLSPSLTTFAFRSSKVRRLLLDLDPYGVTDPLGMFPLFLNSENC